MYCKVAKHVLNREFRKCYTSVYFLLSIATTSYLTGYLYRAGKTTLDRVDRNPYGDERFLPIVRQISKCFPAGNTETVCVRVKFLRYVLFSEILGYYVRK